MVRIVDDGDSDKKMKNHPSRRMKSLRSAEGQCHLRRAKGILIIVNSVLENSSLTTTVTEPKVMAPCLVLYCPPSRTPRGLTISSRLT